MKKRNIHITLALFVISSLSVKLLIIFKYGNLLTLSSDDLNYIKSGIVLLERGILTYQNYTEPTVFITPGYPLFLAAWFGLAGHDFFGIQVVRFIQALISCMGIVIVFLIAKELVDEKVALISAFLISFYMPNITTPGYIMTETLFTTLLLALVYFSLIFSAKPKSGKFIILGVLWAITTLCRPTIALYPGLLFFYILLHFKMRFRNLIKFGAIMFVSFAMIMLPWWVRNYHEYGEFIPLAASSGNPMLQGSYIDYQQTPENTVYYQLGRNAFETNKVEMQAAKMRIKIEWKRDFWAYLKWYTIGKTKILWNGIFYWKEFLGVTQHIVLSYHYVLLLGFASMLSLLVQRFTKYTLIVSVILYFNAIHCAYMTFDRYAFPVMPLISIFCAVFLVKLFEILRSTKFSFVYG